MTKTEQDAARWRYARQFLAVEDITDWAIAMRGHQPDEVESIKSDRAIDALIEDAPLEVRRAVAGL